MKKLSPVILRSGATKDPELVQEKGLSSPGSLAALGMTPPGLGMTPKGASPSEGGP